MKIIVASLRLNGPMGKVIDNDAESLFIKDSCDGSGLNTSENSKDSHPFGLKGFFEWYCSTFIILSLYGAGKASDKSLIQDWKEWVKNENG